ncbi:hypothetical protein HU200_033568 [Digitaria exilis]|uniref:4-coumarate--CoA ligase n=1 Tax=Digitaria exilis TaxID=1010633 RepID=A0A835EPK0_9POAL|nr:hypothetical protein HU200_033568 [Digitaria exilis]
MPPPAPDVDPRSGYCAATKTFHSLRPPLLLPPPDLPLSYPSFTFSLLPAALPSRPALVDSSTGEAVPFPAFLSRVRALAAALRAHLGVSQGHVAFVLAPPSVHVPVLYYALMAVGAIVSPANPALTASEISDLVALSGPSVAFAVKETTGKLPPGLKTVLLDSARFLSFFHEPDCEGTAAGTDVVINQSDAAVILYSSGTTGRAKAVVLTHRNLMASNATRGAAAGDVLMLAVPIFHIYGFTFCLRVAPSANTIVLHTARRFDARAVLAAVGRFGATRLALAPPALLAIVQSAEEDETLISCAAKLQVVNSGGAPLSTELFRRFSHKFPDVCLIQLYLFMNALKPPKMLPILAVIYKIRISATKGYAGDKDSTSATLDSQGWLRTGDLCYIDKDGIVFVIDRLKELIKYKGYQVPPAELESMLQTHPDIDEAAVVPYPDDQAGELPVAFIVRRSGSNLHEAQIKEFVAKQVVHYKRIHHVFLVNAIPKNAAGKILRKDLAKLALGHISSKL